MEKNLANAMAEISSIKSTIENTKISTSGIYMMCFILGSYHLIRSLLFLLSYSVPQLLIVYTIINPLMTLLLFISFLLIYQKEKIYTNKYYLSFLKIWGLLVIALPIMITIIGIINQIYFKDNVSDNIMYVMQSFSDILLFCIFVIIYSYITNKKYMSILVLMILFIYLLLATCFRNAGLPISTHLSPTISITYLSIFNMFVIYFGYILVGILIKQREKL